VNFTDDDYNVTESTNAWSVGASSVDINTVFSLVRFTWSTSSYWTTFSAVLNDD